MKPTTTAIIELLHNRIRRPVRDGRTALVDLGLRHRVELPIELRTKLLLQSLFCFATGARRCPMKCGSVRGFAKPPSQYPLRFGLNKCATNSAELLLSVEPSGAAALEAALKFIGEPLLLGLLGNSCGVG